MFAHLQIRDRRERMAVGLADCVLSGCAWLLRRPPTAAPRAARKILLLRLERIGDLLMALDAIAAIRGRYPAAEIDLVVGSWAAPIAALIPGLSRLETLDAPWLARGADPRAPLRDLVRTAVGWRRRGYDLAINFEGDIRSNVLLALSGATRRVGFAHGGGGPLLTEVVAHDPTEHVAANAMRLVGSAVDSAPPQPAERVKLTIPDDLRQRARSMLDRCRGAGPIVGIHPSGGRLVKQWDPLRFAQVGSRLARERHATLVLTGSAADRPIVARALAALPDGVAVLDLVGAVDLPLLAAVLEQIDLLITGDTGPMHLAAAVGTPIVAVFGPSPPERYGPRSLQTRIVRIDLPCSPCNMIRRPPARCRGHIPDCLTGIGVDEVFAAAASLLRESNSRRSWQT